MKKLLLCLALLALSVPCIPAYASAADAEDSAVSTGLFAARDFDCTYDEASSIVVELLGDTASCTSGTVQIDGGAVTLSGEGPYILRGSLDDGMIIVCTNKKLKTQIILDGVFIHSKTSAPIYVLQSDKTFITAVPGSENTLSNGGQFVPIDDNNIDAAIFSKEDLVLNGSGAISIVSPAGHGVVSKDSLTITGGSIDVSSASHGISGKDGIAIAQAVLSIVSGKDGVHAENDDDEALGSVYIHSGTLNITSGGDGISAASDLYIADGSFTIASGGGSEAAQSARTSDFFGRNGGRDGMRRRFSEDRIPAAPDSSAPTWGADGMPPAAPDSSAPSRGADGIPPAAPDSADFSSESSGGEATEPADAIDSTKGLKAGKTLTVNSGSFVLNTKDDGVHANDVTVSGGSFDVSTGDDAFHADGTLAITDGSIRIAKGYEGLEAQHIRISGGDISLYASDDGVNASEGSQDDSEFPFAQFDGNAFRPDGEDGRRGGQLQAGQTDGRSGTRGSGGRGSKGRDGMAHGGGFGGGFAGMSSASGSIVISGGSLYINSHADGIDANGSLEITGGHTVVCCPAQGDTAALDYDSTAVISGGTFIGTGANFMAQTFSGAMQGVISMQVGSQDAGTEISLLDSAGTALLSCTPELPYVTAILSSPQIVPGETYALTAGSFLGKAAAD